MIHPPRAGAEPPMAPDMPALLVHTIRSGDSLIRIAGQYRDVTRHYALNSLIGEIRRTNGLTSDLLMPGQRLIIPLGSEKPLPVVEEPVQDGYPMRGIYLTGPACGCDAVFDRADRFIQVGGNGVVFDAKDIDGRVTYRTKNVPTSREPGREAPIISNLEDMIRRLHRRRVYVVARIAAFLDGELGRRRPDLALTDPNGAPWTERGQVWVDPAKIDVRRYNIALAVALAEAGVDEVQFDYVRYPTNGWNAEGVTDVQVTAELRKTVITSFFREARQALRDYPVKLSADLYGVMAWGRLADQAVTGQYITAIADYVDIICPMVYPSHYGAGFDGFARPADHPEHFVAEGCRRFLKQTGERVVIRPWLQAFPYGVRRYDGQYVLAQIAAAGEAGASGWCLWNPANRYDVALEALNNPNGDEPISAPQEASAGASVSAEPSEDLAQAFSALLASPSGLEVPSYSIP